ncbi:MAG: hypothetical protein DRR42_01845 [Gammaproteobacteria bacterium]|nr:MAG: hypothetical protein DRR42_01845 [Gammaproteobacteria bacterium]
MSENLAQDTNSPPYVLALTIVRSTSAESASHEDDEEVLFCVRNRSTNLTHPDVVSVPTQRIPDVVGRAIEALGSPQGKSGDTQLLTSAKYSNNGTKGHNPLIYVVESLLASKMAMADRLELGELEFTVELAGTHYGRARYAKGSGENPEVNDDEELRMINAWARIDKGAHLFQGATISYGVQKWTACSDFIRMWDGKDVTIVGLSPQQAVGVCVLGLCITSTYDVLRAKRK